MLLWQYKKCSAMARVNIAILSIGVKIGLRTRLHHLNEFYSCSLAFLRSLYTHRIYMLLNHTTFNAKCRKTRQNHTANARRHVGFFRHVFSFCSCFVTCTPHTPQLGIKQHSSWPFRFEKFFHVYYYLH